MADSNAELLAEVKELTRTLRGYNGNTGLLTEFALLRREVHQIGQEIARINAEGCHYRQKEGDINKNLEERAPTFKWVREKLAIPVVVAVIIALVNGLVIAKVITP
jgi:hypothetical protein